MDYLIYLSILSATKYKYNIDIYQAIDNNKSVYNQEKFYVTVHKHRR